MLHTFVRFFAIILSLSAAATTARAVESKGELMLIITHEVMDFDAWKKEFDADKADREKAGYKDVFVTRDAQKPNLVRVGLLATDKGRAAELVAHPDLKSAMEKAGIVGGPDVQIATVVPHRRVASQK